MSDKEKELIKFDEFKPLPRRIFLGDLVKFAKALALGSIAYPSGLLLASGCGNLSSKTVPGKDDASISVEINGASGTDQDGNPLIRANSRDLLEFVATVRGLSSSVGFFLSTNWGSFQGGAIGTDGYTYFTADQDGKSRAVFVAGASAGRAELQVKSKQKTASQYITFDFATLTIFPSRIQIDGKGATPVNVVARGGLPPIEWSVSSPRAISITPTSADSVRLMVADWDALQETGATGVILYAFDAEGQIAQAVITSGVSSCTTGLMTISPTTGVKTEIAANGITVSVTLDDFDRGSATSVVATVTGPGINSTLTLTQWLTQGIFQGLFTLNTGDAASGTYTFSVPEETDATCTPGTTIGTFVVS